MSESGISLETLVLVAVLGLPIAAMFVWVMVYAASRAYHAAKHASWDSAVGRLLSRTNEENENGKTEAIE